MLSLCRQIIWEWEKSQGREQLTPSKALDENAEQVLKDALTKCGIIPNEEDMQFLDKILDLLYTEHRYE